MFRWTFQVQHGNLGKPHGDVALRAKYPHGRSSHKGDSIVSTAHTSEPQNFLVWSNLFRPLLLSMMPGALAKAFGPPPALPIGPVFFSIVFFNKFTSISQQMNQLRAAQSMSISMADSQRPSAVMSDGGNGTTKFTMSTSSELPPE